MSSYLFYSGLNVYNEVKLLTNSENVLTNIYSPLKIETESFKYLLPIIIISKYLEWIDTALIILDGKNPGLLHLFHHANIVGGFYYGCYTSSYFVTGFLNSFVHIIMYLYYSKIFPNINKRDLILTSLNSLKKSIIKFWRNMFKESYINYTIPSTFYLAIIAKLITNQII